MITIRYLNATDRERSVWGDNEGRVFLDVDGNFEARLSKALDKIGDTDQISQEAGLSGPLPLTNKNRALLEKYRPDVVGRETGPMSIEVTQNGERVNLEAAIITEWSEAEKQAEFEPFAMAFLDLLDGVSLADLTALGTFEFTYANVALAWNDRDSLAVPGLVDLGVDSFGTPGNVTLSDLKTFWFNFGKLLKELFCHIGYDFASPHYLDGEGKYLRVFIPSVDHAWYSGKQSPRYVSTEVGTPVGETGGRIVNTLILDDVFDPDGLYNDPSTPGQYVYDVAFETVVDFRIIVSDFVVELPPSPAGEPAYYFSFIITRVRDSVLTTVFVQNFIGSADQTKTLNINLTYTCDDLIGGDAFLIRTNYRNLGQDGGSGQTYTILSGTVEFAPNPEIFYEGDFIPLHNLLPSTVSGKDLFLAASQLINGKVYVDYKAKKVFLYHPYSYFMPDEETKIQGFYLEGAPIDLRDKTLFSETSWKTEDQKRNRFRVWKFSDSTDPYIESEEQYIKRLDLGTGINKETTSENPLFEPTDELFVSSDYVGGDGLVLPVLWTDDSGPANLKELGARIVNDYGLLNRGQWSFNSTLETLSPYMAMLPTIPLPSSIDFVALTWTGFDGIDLYSRFYEREIEDCRSAITYSLLISGGDETYNLIDFRKTILIQDQDTALEMQPTAVRDHSVGSSAPLLIESRIK